MHEFHVIFAKDGVGLCVEAKTRVRAVNLVRIARKKGYTAYVARFKPWYYSHTHRSQII